jgi:hypothetical protein
LTIRIDQKMMIGCNEIPIKKQKLSKKRRTTKRQKNNETDGHTSHALNGVDSNESARIICDGKVRTFHGDDSAGSLSLQVAITATNESDKNVTVLPPKDLLTTSRTPEEYVVEKKSDKELAGFLFKDFPSPSLQSNQQLTITATGAAKCIISDNVIVSMNQVPVLKLYGKNRPKRGAHKPIDSISYLSHYGLSLWLKQYGLSSRSTFPKLLEERGTETQNDKDTAIDITR